MPYLVAPIALATAFIVGLAMILPFLRRREAQKTLRAAIEKGQTLDPEVVDRILGPRPGPDTAGRDLKTGGVVTLFVGLGLAAMGWLISLGEPSSNAFFALAGTGAMVGLIGLGLIVAGRLAREERRDPR